ncbi:MAG: hypothetical protein NTW95_14225 [Candidatus Aminicenantes bacterium]|nr:hypothetical protein [Candidatus Aminicenantes bacterium]
MKNMLLAALVMLILLPGMMAGEDEVKIVPLEISASAGANALLANLARVQALCEEITSDRIDGDIILLRPQGTPLITLGSLKKGKIKWEHKTVQDKFLALKFEPADYALLAESVKTQKPLAGFQLAVCDAKTQAVIKSFPVAFGDYADLVAQLNYPVRAATGQPLRQEVSVTLENKGKVAARSIRLEIVLSGDDKIPLRSAPAATAYGEDILLEGGSETVPSLEPGQQVTVAFNGSLKIPDDTPPGKHYLAVVVDPDNSVTELSEENNVISGYIMIDIPEPAAFDVQIPETVLQFEPAGFAFKIMWFDTILSDGKDWKLCKMQPNLYQIKHVSWTDCYWEIDTYERAVWEVTGSNFCKKGGRARDLKMKVEVTGGSLTTPPSRFILKLANTRVRFEPTTKKFSLLTYDRPIFHLPFWWVCKLESYLYQIRYVLWQDFFWQVDIFKKEAVKISNGKLCTPGGEASKLPVVVTVEK